MKLSIGIVGLPNVGKSTLFNVLTKQQVLAANYPFATIDPNVGVVAVPDERLGKLTEMSKSRKTVPAIVEFYDIAGLVKGASKGEGLGNQFLTHIRETEAVLVVLRVFKSEDIIHVEGNVDAVRDLKIIETELMLKDFETLEKHVQKMEKDARAGNKEARAYLETARKILKILEGGEPLYASGLMREEEAAVARQLNLLTAKKHLFLINGDEADMGDELKAEIENRKAAYVAADLGVADGVPSLIKEAYKILKLISFFTTGEDETRAWTIKEGTKAPQAAGTIHTDFENKFIKAEVVSYDDFISGGGWSGAKQKGKLRLEGKDYLMKDGDVVVVRHG